MTKMAIYKVTVLIFQGGKTQVKMKSLFVYCTA